MRSEIVIPSSGTIEMYDSVSIPITYSIANIREPEKRSSTYTKTIKVPGTKNNNSLFENIFDANVVLMVFDPNKKIYCYLNVDDITVLTGYLQLGNITVLDNSDVEYEVFIIGQVGNPFNAMGNLELTDLDFSEFNHTYNYPTQIASWTNTWEEGYCYPLIDYGFDNITNTFDVENLQPAIFVKTYVKKILEGIGYTYTSTFIDSTFFQQLVIPCNAQTIVLSQAEIEPLLFNVEQSGSSSGDVNNSLIIDPFIFTNEVNDPSNQYDTGTGIATISVAGNYDIECAFTYDPTISSSSSVMNVNLQIFARGTTSDPWSQIGGMFTQLGQSSPNTTLTAIAANIFLRSGHQVKVVTNFLLTGSGTSSITISDGYFKNRFVNSGLIEGNSLNLNNAVPLKIKQKDFFISIIKMFNLYIDLDPNNPQNLIIETRDDYYSSGDIVDWSEKLDYNSPIEARPMGALDFKELLWNYTEDSDYYNKQYSDKWKERYGRKRYITNNEFQSNINETKVIFSPTPLVNDNTSDRVIPVIWNVDNSNSVSHKSFNIRILYNGGVKTTSTQYKYTGRFTGDHFRTDYLYAGHLDNPHNPTLDLSFGVPREVYYDTTVYTNNNLFNRFFAKYIEQITSVNSRIVTARFHLRVNDIKNLSFQDTYFFDNQYYILNEVKDYDPLSEETVECSFLKLITPIGAVISQTTVNGGLVEDFEQGTPFIFSL